MKLPRKLKKGLDNVWWTKHQILDRLMLVRGNLLKEMKENKGVGAKSLLMEIDFLLNKLKRPYPVTKWTRKAERLPGPAHYIQWRKENKKTTVVADGGKKQSIHP